MSRVKSVLAAIVLAAGLSFGANAATLYTQNLSLNGDGGPFSTLTLQKADEFRVAGSALLSDLVWFGDDICNCFFPTGVFRVRLFDDAGTLPVINPFFDTLVTATITDTGSSTFGSKIFRFDASLATPIPLDGATDYWLSILGTESDPNMQFRWANATTTNPDDDAHAARSFDGEAWVTNDSNPRRLQLAYTLLGTPAASVPEPATLVLLGVGLVAFRVSCRSRKV